MFAKTNQKYPISLLKTIEIKNFIQISKTIGKCDKIIFRSLLSVDSIFRILSGHIFKLFSISFAYAQFAKKTYKFDTIEDAIRWFKTLSFKELKSWIVFLDRIIYA